MSSSKKATGKGKAAAKPKCECADLYKCCCGNRPERPSTGHRWDPEKQEWGGKGHKQKGASAQVATVGVSAKQTAVGKTSIEQWQKLPTMILEDFCRKEKRPAPIYTFTKKNSCFQYQVLVQDAKATKRGGEQDLKFIPSYPVHNQEQAQEEAALLALLHLTPTLPHELKLPEPYKSTWLHAIQNNGSSKKQESTSIPIETNSLHTASKPSTINSSSSSSSSVTTAGAPTATTSREGAKVSTQLTQLNSFTSDAEMKKQLEIQRQKRNEIIRKHEAIRLANRDHPVFMSAKIRKQIEIILRDSSSIDQLLLLQSLNLDDVENDQDNIDTDVVTNYCCSYITQRLIQEGFTKNQAMAAYTATKNSDETDEESWDNVYEQCLQWLCIHLEEDQLPVGFDPRGSTLDVVLPSQGLTKSNSSNLIRPSLSVDDSSTVKPPSHQIHKIMTTFGTSYHVSEYLVNSSEPDMLLWDAFTHVTSMAHLSTKKMKIFWTTMSQNNKDANIQSTTEELEALTAIFQDDLSTTSTLSNDREILTVTIGLRKNILQGDRPEDAKSLVIQFSKGLYPSVIPIVIIKGGWTKPTDHVVANIIHFKLITFLGQQVSGVPILYAIYSFVTDLMETIDAAVQDKYGVEDLLLSFFNHSHDDVEIVHDTSVIVDHMSVNTSQGRDSSTIIDQQSKKRQRIRPSSKNDFWSTPGARFAPAVAFPKVSSSIAKTREGLPASKAKGEFLSKLNESVKSNRVVLITGETGCGKTTQIPQFILEDDPSSKILVTQPRRIAAIGVSTRVAEERGEGKPGEGCVGYVVRGESAISNQCRLLFCTTGVLLRQLQNEHALSCITHIVVDEVHERSLDCDVLLAILREYLPTAPHLRVILMSATLDTDRFASYWGKDTPRLFIPGFTYPVEDFTLEDVLSMTGYIPPKNAKNKNRLFISRSSREKQTNLGEIDTDMAEPIDPATVVAGTTTSKTPEIPLDELVKRVKEDDIDYNIIGRLVQDLVRQKLEDDDGSILVFLPGAPEINQAEMAINFYAKGLKILIIPLHGGIQPIEQQRVFMKSPKGVTKVILSTNIAETSITIPDCTIVIDTGRVKQSSFDPSNRMPILAETFSAKDSLRQRRGRAGRVRQGRCYKLISLKTLTGLPSHSEPEIKRCALDQTILSLLFLGLDDGNGSFLSKLLDPPDADAIKSATYSLEKIGALEMPFKREDPIWQLTPLGMHLAGIPAPPSIGKLLVMGSLLGCRSFSLAMASAMSVTRSPLLKIDLDTRSNQSAEDSLEVMKKENIIKERAKKFAQVGNSDIAFMAHLYLCWMESREKKVFCDQLGLSAIGMKEMKQLYHQLDSSLSTVGFTHNEQSNKGMKSWRLIRSVIVGALSPNQLVRVERAATKYAETAEGSLEVEGSAKELRFFIRGNDNSTMKNYNGITEERVFIHPSSMSFSVSSFSCPWVVYHELVRTSKAFIRDATECSAYALLLFGGKIKVEASRNLILVDGYVRLSANSRIGALIGGLRRKIDEVLTQKVANPDFDISSSVEMKLIVQLIIGDGL